MPRNRYTETIHKDERAQLARQEKHLSAIAKALRYPDAGSEVLVSINKTKIRRETRLDHKRRHKPARLSVIDAS